MRTNIDNRFAALALLLLSVTFAVVALSLGYGIYFFLSFAAIFFLIVFLRYPESPMTIFYPLIWLFWSYNLPLIGGRLERVIGILAIVGILISLARKSSPLPRMPILAWIGPALLLGAYVLSASLNSSVNSLDNLVSLATRILFLYLAFLLLAASNRLRLAATLLIVTGLIGAGIILYWNIEWGLGFFRTYEGYLNAISSLGPFWSSLLTGGNSLTIPAVLLIGYSSISRNALHRNLALLGAGFLFVMAFVAQFRREILITATIVLLYLVITDLNGLRKSALWIVAGLAVFYVLVLQPSNIFQNRIDETAMVFAGTDPRLLSLEAGMHAFLQSPIWGTGPSSYESSAFRQMGPNYPSFYYHAYNVFIYFAVESGILGLGGLLLTLYAAIREITRSQANQNTPQGWILRSAPMLMIVTVVSFLFGNQVELSLPWYIMGLILSAANLAEENKKRP